jgi:hypothetical protein
MALTDAEQDVVKKLTKKREAYAGVTALMDLYYDGEQRLDQLGLAVPPEMRRFVTIVNWPRLVVDALEERCDVKTFIRGDADQSDPDLNEAWQVNNLDSEFHLTAIDSLVQGRGFLSVGTNDDDADHPLILVESPAEMTVDIDPRSRRVTAALKVYGFEPGRATGRYATLYLPNETVWLERAMQRWVETNRDVHNLDRVPVVPFFNRRRSGVGYGISEQADAISITDSAARLLTNLQVAQETHAVPQRYVLGMSKGDFVDANGDPLPTWQAYFSSVWAASATDAKVGQFPASDLRNFGETLSRYAQTLAGLYGLPMRYLGENTANPPSADGIRADEARLVKRAERKMSVWGDQLGRAMALYLRFRDNEWTDPGDRIKTEWHDAATPTYAAKVDGVMKLTGGEAILSREGAWDELGKSEPWKARERARFEAQQSDPVLERLTRDVVDVTGQVGDEPAPVGI